MKNYTYFIISGSIFLVALLMGVFVEDAAHPQMALNVIGFAFLSYGWVVTTKASKAKVNQRREDLNALDDKHGKELSEAIKAYKEKYGLN